MTTKEELQELAQFIVKYGQTLGADQVEAYTLFGSARSVQVERGSIRRFTDTSTSGVGVRIVKDKSIGMSSSSAFIPSQP